MRSSVALTEGIGRVNRAPVVIACVFAVSFATVLPFALTMRGAIERHLGSSMSAEQAARGVNAQWWSEFAAQAGPLGKTFQPTIIGFAAVLDNLSAAADGELRLTPVVWLGAVNLLLWLFLAGGILDRYARARPTRAHEFFAACGVYFVRFLRLLPFVALVYYALFAVLHPLLFDQLYERATRDVTVERTAFLIRLALYLVFGLVLGLTNVVFDYAKVRAVVEDRRSMLGALAAGARFVSRNFAGVATLYLMNGALFLAVLLLYALVAPGADSAGARVWLGFLVGQAYLVTRIWVRLVFFSAETSLFQGRLAHAGYVANSSSPRPEPPIVERLLEPRTSRESMP